MASNRFASGRTTAAQSSADAAAAKAGAGTINPTATARAYREEGVAARPKFGSTPLQRKGGDPLYAIDPNSGQGVQSSRNASAAGFDNIFHPVAWDGAGAPAPGSVLAATHMAAPTHMASNVVQPPNPFAGDPETQSALGITPNVPGAAPVQNVPHGTIPAGESTLGWPHVDWTGPSLLPQVGPGSAPPFMPGQQGTNFTVPKPLTGPGGNAGTDAADLAANRALSAPGGASGLWNGGPAPTYTPAPGDFARVDYVQHPTTASSSAPAVDWSAPAAGGFYPQPPAGLGDQTPSGSGTPPTAQAKPNPDDEEEGQKSASTSRVDAYSSVS